VKTLASFHFQEETFCRHDHLGIVSIHCYNCKYRWIYKIETWEEEEINCRVMTYDEFVFRRWINSQHIGRVEDEKKYREEQDTRKEE
jgi:hypothetical protein